MEHRPDDDTVAPPHPVSEAGKGRPFLHFAARREDVLLVPRAQKIEPRRVEEIDVVEQPMRQSRTLLVDEARTVRDDPPVERDGQE